VWTGFSYFGVNRKLGFSVGYKIFGEWSASRPGHFASGEKLTVPIG